MLGAVVLFMKLLNMACLSVMWPNKNACVFSEVSKGNCRISGGEKKNNQKIIFSSLSGGMEYE